MADRPSVRVNLSLPPEAVAVLDRLAALTGSGRSTVVREFVMDALPLLQQTISALEAVHLGNRQAFDLVGDAVQAAAAEIVGQASDLRTVIRGRRKPRIKWSARD